MARLQRLVLVAIAVILLCAASANSQQNSSTQEDVQATNAALREKAYDLLMSLAGQLNSLQSAENRARLGSNIAGSLWPHDEKRARTLFGLVEEDIKAGLQNPDSQDPRDVHTHLVFLKLRADTVRRIAKHDAELALAFLRATRVSSNKRSPNNAEMEERVLEARLAKEIAARNPDLALKAGRQSLSRGLSHELLLLLRQLNRTHKEHGLILYKETVNKIRSIDIAKDWETMQFARTLAVSFNPPNVDDLAFRELINMFFTYALASGCDKKNSEHENGYHCAQIATLLPLMEKVDPSRAALLRHNALVSDGSGPFVVEGYNELTVLSETGSVDEILALASTYPDLEGAIRSQGLSKAAEAGDLERAQRIASDYTGDPETKARLLAMVERYQKWTTMNAELMTEVQARLVKMPQVRQRIWFLLQLANRLGPTDRKAALTTLNQASGMIDSMKPGKEQTEALMALAMMYCLEKNERGFAIMETVVPTLNELVASAVKLDGFDNRYLREGEWNMTAEGGVGELLTGLARGAGYFAWFDFDRAVSLAAQFERPEIRLMAQLKLAQGILAGPTKRFSMANSMLP